MSFPVSIEVQKLIGSKAAFDPIARIPFSHLSESTFRDVFGDLSHIKTLECAHWTLVFFSCRQLSLKYLLRLIPLPLCEGNFISILA
jgi:hypothetical protein